jgi:hypothetical protein
VNAKLLFLTALVVGAVAFGASAVPAFSGDTAVVTAKISAAAPCVQVTPSAVDFGSANFSTDSAASYSKTQQVDVTNCGSSAQQLFGRANDANGPRSTWNLVTTATCPGSNTYGIREGTSAGGATNPIASDLGVLAASMASGDKRPEVLRVLMPCTGSTGGDETMTFNVTFVATL